MSTFPDRDEVGGLVGRSAALTELDALLAKVQAGGTAAVAVTGEPGIGKTRLLGELAGRARSLDLVVLAAGGAGIAPDIPFGLVVEALDARASGLGAEPQRRLGPARLDELGRILPSLPRAGTAPAPGNLDPLSVDRIRAYEAVRALIEELTHDRPGVLLLDDLQWADQASAELVSYLLRRGVPRTLVALAYRTPAPPGLATATARAARDGALRLLPLEPLSVAEMGVLIGDQVAPPAREQLQSDSGGNPFYLLELLRSSAARTAGPSPALAPASEVPPGVRAAISHELAQLSPAALTLAHAAALVGDPFEVGLSAQVAGIDDAEASPALDELVSADTLRPTGTPGRYRFRHPIVRRAIYSDAGPGWRLEAHQRAADVLGSRGERLGVRAHHVLRSAVRIGDDDAVALLVEAGLDAASRVPTAAAAWFDGAARRLPDDAPVDQHLSILTALAEMLTNAGRLDESRAAIDRALRLAPRADVPGRRQLALAQARLGRLDGSSTDALSVISTALDQTSEAETADLTLHLAFEYMLLGRWSEAVAATDDARALAAGLGDDELLDRATAAGAAYRSWGVAAGSGGDTDTDAATDTGSGSGTGADAIGEARDLADQVAARLDARADHELTLARLDAYALLCLAELNLERWAPLEIHAERAIDRCQQTGEDVLRVFLVQTLAMGRTLQGRLTEARQGADTIAAAGEATGADQPAYDFVRAQILSSRSWLLTLQGQLSAALAVSRDAVDAARRTSGVPFGWMATVSQGIASIEAGEHEIGLGQLLVAGGPALTDVPPAARPRALRYLAEAAMALDRVPVALAAARRAEWIAAQLGLATRTADARYARALVHLGVGQHAAAAETALAAAASYESPGAAIEAARARMLAASALLAAADAHADSAEPAADEVDAAVAHLQQAHGTFAASGAAVLADRAARRLGDLGVPLAHRRSRARAGAERSATGPESLSTREREVAALVAEGHTNRQIAEALYVSRKTVETHLARIFAKLGVSRRGAMVEALRGR